MTQKLYYENASQNQRLRIEEILNRGLVLQSALVNLLLSKKIDGIGVDEIQNSTLPACPECGEEVEPETEDGVITCNCGWSGDERDLDSEDKKIYEWWLVTDKWLARRLNESGAAMLVTDYGTWYGRTSTGQALSLDAIAWDALRDLVEDLS